MSDTCKVITLATILASQAFLAQQVRAQEDDAFKRPLGQGKAQRMQGEARSTITQNDNGNSLRVEIVNGNVDSVTHNGEKLAKDRYRYENGKLEVLDKDGKVVHELQVGVMGEMPAMPPMPRVPALPDVPLLGDVFRHGPRVMVAPRLRDNGVIKQPKVRMGIMMAADGEAEAVIISGVTEDSPAEKAGLKVGDVIERIDGKRVRTQQDLRDALLEKNPGDKVQLRVERDSNELEISVDLAKADDAAPVQGFSFVYPGDGQGNGAGGIDAAQKELAKAVDELQSALGELNKEKVNLDGAKVQLQEALNGLRATREQLAKMLEGNGIEVWGQRFGENMGAWGERFGDKMGRMGEEIARQFEGMDQPKGNAEVRREIRREFRNNDEQDAETRELRDMLKAMQDRLDRLEQQGDKKPE